jgi:hypothetical protein
MGRNSREAAQSMRESILNLLDDRETLRKPGAQQKS